IDQALAEDQAFNDPTTRTLIPHDLQATAVLRAKAPGVLAGVEVALAVFRRVDAAVHTEARMADGSPLKHGDTIATARGRAAGLLAAERTALNFLQRMSGIATETARYVEAVKGHKAAIVDTRKTLPGWRELDKYAVRMGGGRNHRMNLADGILVKDNHIAALFVSGLSLKEIVALAVRNAPHTLKVEVEVAAPEEAAEAVDAGAHIVMLDNMPPAAMRRAVALVAGRALVEASGGVTLVNVREVAATGVDIISIGALTHSPRALDISMDLEF
ncbi:MAG: carboxylating nicotinate-nucleotide diphosphorylase, partial [Chloroflexota bacterium]|nr:carboxylating nicotinate-nucleotide diphosphorylase [Chloroflexota bacterium]